MRRWISFVLTAGATIAVALPGDAGAAPPALNPCTLVKTNEAAQALGAPVTQRLFPSETLECHYRTAAALELSVVMMTPDYFERHESDATTRASGIGNKAYWVKDPVTPVGASLSVLKGGNAVRLDVLAPTIQNPRRWQPMLVRLGKLAASRM